MESFAEYPDSVITMEHIREIGNTVLIKALRHSEQKRHFSTLTFLSSVSDYPDSVFNYDTNE